MVTPLRIGSFDVFLEFDGIVPCKAKIQSFSTNFLLITNSKMHHIISHLKVTYMQLLLWYQR